MNICWFIFTFMFNIIVLDGLKDSYIPGFWFLLFLTTLSSECLTFLWRPSQPSETWSHFQADRESRGGRSLRLSVSQGCKDYMHRGSLISVPSLSIWLICLFRSSLSLYSFSLFVWNKMCWVVIEWASYWSGHFFPPLYSQCFVELNCSFYWWDDP